MSDADIPGIRAAGQLHDIGEVTVDKTLSIKSSPLRPEEFREIADHTIMGHQIVSSVRFPWPQVPEVVRWHHERADGSGYPDNLRNDDVSLPVRLPSHEIAMLCLLALRDEETRAFLHEQNWREARRHPSRRRSSSDAAVRNLEFLWPLEVGIWHFSLRASVEFRVEHLFHLFQP